MNTLRLAAILGFMAVLFGAMGAHALKTRVDPAIFSFFQTAERLHWAHTLALFGVGLLQLQRPQWQLRNTVMAFCGGIVLFCGSLYALCGVAVLTGHNTLMLLRESPWFSLVHLTPMGGMVLLAGWALLTWRLFKH